MTDPWRAYVEIHCLQETIAVSDPQKIVRRYDNTVGPAASTACEIFKTRVLPGQYYRLTDGVWRKRDNTPVPLPSYCG